MVWSWWVTRVGEVARVGPLTVENNVAEQLATLQAENARLRAELIDYRQLREQLGGGTAADFTPLPALVAARPLEPWQAAYVINRGAVDGVVLGAPVVIHGSTLVGFITELHERTAVLQLLFHPATSFPADVIHDDELHRGLVSGKTFTAVEIRSIPRDAPLQAGQRVVTAGQADVVPAGLLVGETGEIRDELHEPFRQSRLALPYDPSRLRAVVVLVP